MHRIPTSAGSTSTPTGMKNTTYMEKSVDCRLRYFNSTGVSPDIFAKWKVAFVVVSDRVTYRELFPRRQDARSDAVAA